MLAERRAEFWIVFAEHDAENSTTFSRIFSRSSRNVFYRWFSEFYHQPGDVKAFFFAKICFRQPRFSVSTSLKEHHAPLP